MARRTLPDGIDAELVVDGPSEAAIVNGLGERTTTAKLTHWRGSGLQGYRVDFTINGPGGLQNIGSATTNSKGVASKKAESLQLGSYQVEASVGDSGLTDSDNFVVRGLPIRNPDYYELLIRGLNGSKSFDLKVTSNKGACPGAKGRIAILQQAKQDPRLEFTTDANGLTLVPEDGNPFKYEGELFGTVVLAGMEEKVKQVPFRLPPPGPIGWKQSAAYDSKSWWGKFKERFAHRNNTRANVFIGGGILWFVLNCIFVGTGAVDYNAPPSTSVSVTTHVGSSYAEEARQALKNRPRPGKSIPESGASTALPPSDARPEPKIAVPVVARVDESSIYISWQFNLFFLLLFCPLYWLASWREEIAYVLKETRYWKNQTVVVTGAEDGQIVKTDMPKDRTGFRQYLQQSMPSGRVPFGVLFLTELIAEFTANFGERLLLHRGQNKPTGQAA